MHGVLETERVGASCNLATDREVTRARRSSLPHRRLTEDQSRLVSEHWEFALAIAARFAKRYPRYRIDWEGAVAIGICQAAATFEVGRSSFRTHMDRRVKGACVDAMRQCGLKGYGRYQQFQGAPRILSLDEHIELHGRPTTHAAVIPSGELPTGWETEAEDEVRGLTRRLPRKHGEVLRSLYLRGRTMKAAGREVGLSESRVSQIHDQAIGYLREALA